MESIILICFLCYTLLLFVIMGLTSRQSSNDAFFRGNRRSPWFVVAYGMIGASLSGVTFMSVPGGVYYGQFTYMPLVLGYVLGYAVIATVLLPIYYKLNLTSIYTYLAQRFGSSSERVGALFFILSRLLGSALRMYLVVYVLYEFVFKAWGVPFWVPALIFIVIILLYTFRGGIKTIVWTDTLQTTFLILAAVATAVAVLKSLDMSLSGLWGYASDRGLTKMFDTDVSHPKYYWKQIVSGMFITITMTGLDQDMMQKNLTCKSLRDAQKNVMTSSMLFIVVNVIFLMLGAALICYADFTGFELALDGSGRVIGDKIFPSIAFSLNGFTAVVFVLGMVAAGYSSADGTLAALTTTFCYDFLHFDRSGKFSTERQLRLRKWVHVGFAALYLVVIIAFRPFHTQSLIDTLFDIAGYTYGPLLGLFTFGLFTKGVPRDRWVPVVAVMAPVISFILKRFSAQWFGGYKIGFEILLINGLLTFIGLWLISFKSNKGRGLVALKSLFVVLSLGVLMGSCSRYTVYTPRDNPACLAEGGVVYALPRTLLKVSVVVESDDFTNAPYHSFAEDLLGVEAKAAGAKYRLSALDVSTVAVADGKHSFYVVPKRAAIEVDSRGLLRSVGMDMVRHSDDDSSLEEELLFSRGLSAAEWSDSPAVMSLGSNHVVRVDTFYSRYDVPGHPTVIVPKRDVQNLKAKAEEAVARIETLRDKQQQLLFGDYEGVYSYEAIKYLQSQLQEQERALTAMFTGRKQLDTFTVYINPLENREYMPTQSYPIGLFSPEIGFSDSLNTGGDTVWCHITSLSSLRTAGRFVRNHTVAKPSALRQSRHRLVYRLSEQARVEICVSEKRVEKHLPVSQFGVIGVLPKGNVQASFDSRTGNLRSVQRR